MTYFMAGEGRRHVRPDGAVGAARQVRDVGAPAARRLRDHHAVEFPDGDPVVEDHPGARLRQHRRVQAGDADAAVGGQLRARCSRTPACRRASSTSSPATAPTSATPLSRIRDACASSRSPARPRSGRIVEPGGAPSLQEGPPRDGRQERHHRHGRREPRAGGRRLPVGRLRHDRAALHGGQPRRRAREGLRRVPRSVRRARAGRCASATAWIRRRRWGRRSARRSSRR